MALTLPPHGPPTNVVYFEALLYASLVLDALSAAFADRTPDADMTEATIMAANVVAVGLIALFVYLVHIAARQRKGWPRWVLAISLGLSTLSLSQSMSINGLQFDTFVGLISSVLTAAGLYFAFTGDAKSWFTE